MRIFLSCQQALKAHPVPAYAFWEYYLRSALTEAGHEVVQAPDVDWAEGLMPLSAEQRAAWLDRTWTRTVDFIQAEHRRNPIRLFLGYLFPLQVEPSAVRTIRGAGVPTVNFFCDNVREFTEVPANFRDFDLHWVPEADARSMYAHRAVSEAEDESVIFVGSHDVLREDLLGEAVGKGVDVQIYGPGWLDSPQDGAAAGPSKGRRWANQMEFLRKEGFRGLALRATYQLRRMRPRDWIGQSAHPPLADEAYFKATREAKVVIGINRCPSFRRSFSNPLRYSRLRDIEAPMLGACYLTEMAPGLGDLYEVGAEIETYRNAGELIEKAKQLKADPRKRLRLRQGGQRRALAHHTIEKSVARISRELGIPE